MPIRAAGLTIAVALFLAACDGPVALVVKDLRSPSAAVRERAARELRRTGDAETVPALVAALQDSVVRVRWEAATSLGTMRAFGALEPLIGRLQDSDPGVAAASALALGEIGDPDAFHTVTSSPFACRATRAC